MGIEPRESSDGFCPMATSLPTHDTAAGSLSPVLGDRWALGWKHLTACLLFGGIFLYVNYRPLLDSKIWLHVHQGQWTLTHAALPETDATQPLSEGMTVVMTDWLSQVVFALADQWGGPQYVSNLFAVAMLGCFLMLARVFYLQTRNVGLMIVGVGIVLLLGRHLQSSAGPDVFGHACFAALLWLVTRLVASGFGPLRGSRVNGETAARGAWPYWAVTAALFVAWANLHGSFLLGIAVLACCAVGRAIEVGWKARGMAAVISDRPTQRWTLLTQWATVWALVNPYGLDLLRENVALLHNESVQQMPQWLPLSLATLSGVLLLASVGLLAAVLRHGRRQVQPAEALLLLVFGAAVASTGRAMAWYAPVLAFVVMPHLSDIAGRVWVGRVRPDKEQTTPSSEETTPSRWRFAVSPVCVLVVWCSFALSPTSQGILGGTPRKAEFILGLDTPLGVAELLRKQPSTGLVFAPLPWADFLAGDGVPQFQAYMTSNVQWVPWRVWSDYARIARAETGWDRALDRYGVSTVIVQKSRQEPLRKAVRQSDEWRTVFDNAAALVAQRKEPPYTSPTDE